MGHYYVSPSQMGDYYVSFNDGKTTSLHQSRRDIIVPPSLKERHNSLPSVMERHNSPPLLKERKNNPPSVKERHNSPRSVKER
jgi:hypothetical protein